MLTQEFITIATKETRAKLNAQSAKPDSLRMKRGDYIAFINGMIKGFEICNAVTLAKDAKRDIVIDIMINSGVLNDVLI